MKRSVFLGLFIASLLSPAIASAFQPEPATLIFVRHAERADDGTRNPPISEEGQARAENLYQVLKGSYDVAAIYSTGYKRTQMTAQPTADSLGIEIQEYGLGDFEGLLKGLISEYAGKTVLIVGHSNTTPALINMVIGDNVFEQLDESAYGDLFVVTSNEYGQGEVELFRF